VSGITVISFLTSEELTRKPLLWLKDELRNAALHASTRISPIHGGTILGRDGMGHDLAYIRSLVDEIEARNR
jgi:hypothetical protein